MRKFSKEYLEFKQKHLKELEELYYETYDENLRQIILKAREELEKY